MNMYWITNEQWMIHGVLPQLFSWVWGSSSAWSWTRSELYQMLSAISPLVDRWKGADWPSRPHEDVLNPGTKHSMLIIQWHFSGYLCLDRSLVSCWESNGCQQGGRRQRGKRACFVGCCFYSPGERSLRSQAMCRASVPSAVTKQRA